MVIDNVTSRTENHKVERGLGAIAAILTWLSWLIVAPALGFPSLASVAMINRAIFPIIPEAGHNPGFWLGWLIVIAGLVVAIAVYAMFDRLHILHAGIRTGLIYGAGLWLVAGVIIMPLLGLVEPARRLPASLDPMQPTLMMHSLGPSAAVAALIGWVLFGAILWATERAPV